MRSSGVRIRNVRFRTENNDFEVVQTDKGFDINVDDKSMHYNVLESNYLVDKKSKNFFIIEEFESK